MRHVKNLHVIYGSKKNASMPASALKYGWEKVAVDLNKGAGGKYVYLYKQMSDDPIVSGQYVESISISVSDIENPPGVLIDGESSSAQSDRLFGSSDIDLNMDAGGKYLYLEWQFGTKGKVILDVDVVTGDSRGEALSKVLPNWKYVDTDLNLGAGGDYIYLIYLEHQQTP